MDISAEKKSLRREAREKRADLSAELPDFAARIAGHASAFDFAQGSMVGGYAALPGEADPHLLLQRLAAEGCALAFPRVVAKDQPLVFHRWSEGRALIEGAYGVPEPAADWTLASPDIFLIPLLAFDGQGYRLGYGGGYYDRTLGVQRSRRSVVVIGIAFAGQEVARVPHEPSDQRLDWIVTERGLRKF